MDLDFDLKRDGDSPNSRFDMENDESAAFEDERPVTSTSKSSKKAGKRKLVNPLSDYGSEHESGVDEDGEEEDDEQEVEEEYSKLARAPILLPSTVKLPNSNFEFYTTRSHPVNKNGFRYTSCGPSPTPDLPTPLHWSIPSAPDNVRFSWEDRSPFVLITDDAKTITAEKGWRGARANVGIREGCYYWEVKIERGGDASLGQGSWVRVGVGRRESPVNAPVGIDGHSYAIRDKTGDKITRARPIPFGKPFKTHSVIGVYLQLPKRKPIDEDDEDCPGKIVRKRVAIRYKGQLYYESLEYKSSPEMVELNEDPANKVKSSIEEDSKKSAPGTKSHIKVKDSTPPLRPLPILEGSKIAFFIDGVCQGVAFENLFDFLPLRQHEGTAKREAKVSATGILNVVENFQDDGALGYFPTVSVFGGGIATLNPGPDFDFPPPPNIHDTLVDSPHPPTSTSIEEEFNFWKPLSERHEEFFQEQLILDELDEQEALITYHQNNFNEIPEKSNSKRTKLAEMSSASMQYSGQGTPMAEEMELDNFESKEQMKNELKEL